MCKYEEIEEKLLTETFQQCLFETNILIGQIDGQMEYFKEAFDALVDGQEEQFFYKILANHFIPNSPHIDDSDIFIGR